MQRFRTILLRTQACLTALCVLGMLTAAATTACLAEDVVVSPLWGSSGQAWKPDGRLPDFSYAGYHSGERPLPARKADVNVRDFGATGDGRTDDTAAFQKAVRQAAGKVIAVPPGRYVITDIIEIERSGTALRGAGPHQTVIVAPTPLQKIRPNMGATTTGRPTSNYSWSGGLIWAKGQWESDEITIVAAEAKRGDTNIAVAIPVSDRLQVGADVCLLLNDDEVRSLTRHLYADDPGDFTNLQPVRERFIARIVDIDGKTGRIGLDRPLRTDVRLSWTPVLAAAASSVQEVGIEGLAFEFPVRPYAGHFTEQGYNAVAFSQVRHGWVRDIEVRNADSGIFINGANITITNVVLLSQRDPDDGRHATGHHGISLGGAIDVLVTDFNFRTKFIHDITMSRGSTGNVVRNGRGEDLTFDHHKYANHSNLFTNIDAGEGTNIFRSGGGANLGRHCGAHTTWWNIRTRRPVKFPAGWAPERITLVGVRSHEPAVTLANGRWFEPSIPDRLDPTDLYAAQLQRRLSGDAGDDRNGQP